MRKGGFIFVTRGIEGWFSCSCDNSSSLEPQLIRSIRIAAVLSTQPLSATAPTVDVARRPAVGSFFDGFRRRRRAGFGTRLARVFQSGGLLAVAGRAVGLLAARRGYSRRVGPWTCAGGSPSPAGVAGNARAPAGATTRRAPQRHAVHRVRARSLGLDGRARFRSSAQIHHGHGVAEAGKG